MAGAGGWLALVTLNFFQKTRTNVSGRMSFIYEQLGKGHFF